MRHRLELLTVCVPLWILRGDPGSPLPKVQTRTGARSGSAVDGVELVVWVDGETVAAEDDDTEGFGIDDVVDDEEDDTAGLITPPTGDAAGYARVAQQRESRLSLAAGRREKGSDTTWLVWPCK